MNVSVIVPAYNAAETISDTLASLCAQTFPGWEAIVVDDGSTDRTTAIAAGFAERDSRIRVVTQPRGGVSAARNSGIALARYDWLLFLDADDWLLPQHLERMTDALISNPDLDVVHCGWTRVTSDGKCGAEQHCHQSGELFDVFARTNAFATTSVCVVRRLLVEAVGSFDPSFSTCGDWDLWQRIARTGAYFGAITDVLVRYRMRSDSVSHDGLRVFTDGLRVQAQGHSSDPRVPDPHPTHANGLPVDRLSTAHFYLACWCAGLMLGRGEDACSLMNILQDHRAPELEPSYIAETLFEAVPFAMSRLPSAWDELWPASEQRLDEFLSVLEEQTQASELAHRTRTILERLILENVMGPRPLTIGTTYAICLEVTEPISDIMPPPSTERLRCEVELERESLGTIELPVCDEFVSGDVIADAIAAEYAWAILGRFFEKTIYPKLRIERGPTGLSLWRGALRLANRPLNDAEDDFWSEVHHHIGWTIFLQEIWGRPDWPSEYFYDAQLVEGLATRCHASNTPLTVELSEDLPDVVVSGDKLEVVLTVGGVARGGVTVPAEQNTVHAHEMRVALTMASGFDLCRAVVREGLLGRPLAGPGSLQTRLAAASASAQREGMA